MHGSSSGSTKVCYDESFLDAAAAVVVGGGGGGGGESLVVAVFPAAQS